VFNYPSGSPVRVTFPLVDNAGVVVDPVSGSYRVLDEDMLIVVATTSLGPLDANASVVDIDIPALQNTVPGGRRITSRTVELTLVFASGELGVQEQLYTLTSGAALAVNVNSYQTYAQAVIEALDIPNIPYWEKASVAQRSAALIDAHFRLGKLSYVISAAPSNWQTHIDWKQSVNQLNSMTNDEFLDLPDYFRAALRKAQVAEAETQLGGDEIDRNRKDGLVTNTVGESSQFYRPSKPINLPVSRRALRYLSGYVSYNMRVGRG
jgi:hypothetical protein